METVSILIPCYNDAAYVGDAIESALGQTWPECEVVVVDDGSSDDSRAVAQTYESYGVRVIAQENQGASAARNRAFEAASGEYIQYLDADDLLHPRKIEAQVAALQNAPADTVAVCSTVYFRDGTAPEGGRRARGDESIPWLTSEDPVQWLINLWLPDNGWGMVQTGAWLVPRGVAEEAGPWDERIARDQDGEYFTRVVFSSSAVQYVGDGCVYYRQHPQGVERVSSRVNRDGLKGWLRAIDSKRDHLLPHAAGDQREELTYGLARQYWTLALDAYPSHPDITARAEQRAADLGHPVPLRTVSENGWKGTIAQGVRSYLGWRSARWLQHTYHRTRTGISGLLPS
jgi:glycosyltransferase involved in cell wall biosynthesis